MCQSLQMIFQPKQFSAEGAELLGDGRPLHESGVIDRYRQFGRGNHPPIEKRLRFIHTAIIGTGVGLDMGGN